MSSFIAQSTAYSAPGRFSPAELSFALAWEVYAPGLGGWTIQVDTDDDGSEYMLVDPPLVYGNGFTVRPDGAGIHIQWAHGSRRTASLREAMLLICPLCPNALVAVEQLAAAPAPVI